MANSDLAVDDLVKVKVNERTSNTSPINLAGRYGHVLELLCPTSQWEPTAAVVKFADFEETVLLEDLEKQKQ